jgi:glc operon protein GlcG
MEMLKAIASSTLAASVVLLLTLSAWADDLPVYGQPIGLDKAKQVADAAAAEAQKNGWAMAIAIVDPAGMLVFFEKLDNTQNGSVRVSQEKARSAALFRRPTKVFEDALVGGRQAILALSGAVPIDGGVPLVSEGKIVGAVGVSGGTSPQDGQVARAVAGSFK